MLFDNTPAFLIFFGVIVSCLDSIRYCLPFARTDYCQLHVSFDIRLVKARKDSEAMESLKLSVKILFVIFAVSERM